MSCAQILVAVTDKTAYLKSEGGDDFCQTVSKASHLDGIRVSRCLFEISSGCKSSENNQNIQLDVKRCGRFCQAATICYATVACNIHCAAEQTMS